MTPSLTRRDGVRSRRKLLDAAESLFAAQGFGATSVRAVTRRAGANPAAVHYHFGGKLGLFEEVLRRRIEPLDALRRERLAALRAEAEGAAPRLEDLVEALAAPLIELAEGGRRGAAWVQLVARYGTEPGDHWGSVARWSEPLYLDYLASFRAALPGLAQEEVAERVALMLGTVVGAISDTRTRALVGLETSGPESASGRALERLVAFVCGGLRARAQAAGPSLRAAVGEDG